MNMTREEAIEALQKFVNGYEKNICGEAVRQNGFVQAIKVVISALRPVSREQVEKVWRAHWNESTHLGGFVYCSRCGYNALEANNYTFCPKCGSPFTDEAVEMVMEKINNMEEMTNEH